MGKIVRSRRPAWLLTLGTVALLAALASSCVQPPPPKTLTGLEVTPVDVSVAAGREVRFTATGHYSDGSSLDVTQRATWSSDDATVAVVSNARDLTGHATGVAAGTTQIRAVLGSKGGSATITVTPAVVVSIDDCPAPWSVSVGGTVSLTAVATFSDGHVDDITQSATWSSSDETIARITGPGVVTGVATGGPVTIRAAAGGIVSACDGMVL